MLYCIDVLATLLKGRTIEKSMTICWPQKSAKIRPLISLANGILVGPLIKRPKFRLLGATAKINLSISRTPGGRRLPQSIYQSYFF
jgi:hypothetical protein